MRGEIESAAAADLVVRHLYIFKDAGAALVRIETVEAGPVPRVRRAGVVVAGEIIATVHVGVFRKTRCDTEDRLLLSASSKNHVG